jgi:hypothetical protein
MSSWGCWSCLCGVLTTWLACAADKPAPRTAADPPPASPSPAASPTDAEAWRRRPLDERCHAQLAALVDGQLDRFAGVPRCGRADAEAALGPSGDEPSRFEQLGEYRVYPRASGRVMVWFAADDIRVMQLVYPKLPRTIDALLGAPEGKAQSGLSTEWEQWIYAGRGLTAHVRRGSKEVVALFAYPATTVDAFLATDIARVAKRQSPVEELK